MFPQTFSPPHCPVVTLHVICSGGEQLEKNTSNVPVVIDIRVLDWVGGADALNEHLIEKGLFIERTGLSLSLSKPSNSSISREEEEEEEQEQGEENNWKTVFATTCCCAWLKCCSGSCHPSLSVHLRLTNDAATASVASATCGSAPIPSTPRWENKKKKEKRKSWELREVVHEEDIFHDKWTPDRERDPRCMLGRHTWEVRERGWCCGRFRCCGVSFWRCTN